METKRFTKNDSGFVCANCGARVEELGYSSRNHCPKGLCSLHLDLYPGDRAAGCGGIMDPVSVTGNILTCHYCEKEQDINKVELCEK